MQRTSLTEVDPRYSEHLVTPKVIAYYYAGYCYVNLRELGEGGDVHNLMLVYCTTYFQYLDGFIRVGIRESNWGK